MVGSAKEEIQAACFCLLHSGVDRDESTLGENGTQGLADGYLWQGEPLRRTTPFCTGNAEVRYCGESNAHAAGTGVRQRATLRSRVRTLSRLCPFIAATRVGVNYLILGIGENI